MDPERPWIVERARATPSATGLRIGDACFTFGELSAGARSLAEQLIEAGVREGDVVAALVGNELSAALLAYATPLCGAVLLPLNTRLAAPELAFQLTDAGVSLLIHGKGALEATARAAAPSGVVQARIDAKGNLGVSQRVPVPEARALCDRIDLASPYAILYTSGTTGQPKGAVLTHGNFLASAEASAAHLGSRADDDWLAALPLFHVGGLSILTRSVLMGTRVTVQSRFDPAEMNRALDQSDITLVSLVATMLRRLLDARGGAPAPRRLRCVLLGGGPAPASLIARAEELGFPVAPTYGLTEATSQVATRPPGTANANSDGGLLPLPGVEIRIVDDEAGVLGAGEEGEILVRGPTVMRGYLSRPDATARALRAGWLHTGDVGVVDEQGGLRVLDRRSDLILSGGENVYPAQVEAVLEAHPDVVEAAVVARRDDEYGERPVAWVVAAAGCAPSADELTQHCRGRLAGYAVPVAIRFTDVLPRTSAGKLLRRSLPRD